MDGYLGEIKMFAGTFPPMYWQFCQGQTLSISQYSALYSIIGIQFGGDGINNFKLPDLRGRVPIGAGNGTNLTPRAPGDNGGAESVTLATANLPIHTHGVKCDVSSGPPQQSNTPVNNLPSTTSSGTSYAPGTSNNSNMKADMLTNAGNSQAHDNMPPWGCLNYIICIEGVWPPRE
jgi:microcystin-dependent protein